MLYVRGNPADYDNWAQMGCRGWSYDEVLPFFRKSETYRGNGDPEYRSQGGPLIVEDYRTILPLTHRFVEAAQQAGFPFTPDYNGKQQEGVAYSQMTRRGKWRGSTAQTFLREARGRGNLKVETNAIATRLLFEGRRCIGVAFRQNGVDREVRAAREVILSGGAVNSPHVLQISGIGPAEHLQIDRRAGIARSARGRRQSQRPLRRARLAPGAQRGDDQPACPRRAADARSGQVRHTRQWRADLRRHLGHGVLPQPRRALEPRPAAAVHPGELCPGGLSPAGA